jgi:Derlin-2/3
MIIPGLYFLGPSLVTLMIYVWSRKDAYGQVTFFGFRFSMWQLPFVLMVFHVLLGGSVIPDIAGILAGHVYHFAADIIPKVYGITVIKTPSFLAAQFGDASPASSRPWRMAGTGYRLNE